MRKFISIVACICGLLLLSLSPNTIKSTHGIKETGTVVVWSVYATDQGGGRYTANPWTLQEQLKKFDNGNLSGNEGQYYYKYIEDATGDPEKRQFRFDGPNYMYESVVQMEPKWGIIQVIDDYHGLFNYMNGQFGIAVNYEVITRIIPYIDGVSVTKRFSVPYNYVNPIVKNTTIGRGDAPPQYEVKLKVDDKFVETKSTSWGANAQGPRWNATWSSLPSEAPIPNLDYKMGSYASKLKVTDTDGDGHEQTFRLKISDLDYKPPLKWIDQATMQSYDTQAIDPNKPETGWVRGPLVVDSTQKYPGAKNALVVDEALEYWPDSQVRLSAEGIHQFHNTVKSSDNGTILSGKFAGTYKIDSTVPTISIGHVEPGTQWKYEAKDLLSGVDESKSRIVVTKAGAPPTSGVENHPSTAWSPRTTGIYDVYGKSIDNAGNDSGWVLAIKDYKVLSQTPSLNLIYAEGSISIEGTDISGAEYRNTAESSAQTGGIHGWSKFPLVAECVNNAPAGTYNLIQETQLNLTEKNTSSFGAKTTMQLTSNTPNLDGHLLKAWGAPIDSNVQLSKGVASASYKIDQSPPVASATWNGNRTVTNNSSDDVSAIRDDGTQIYFQKAGAASPTGEESNGWQTIKAPGAGNSSLTIPTVAGRYDLYVQTKDYAGNTGINLVTNGTNIAVQGVEFYGVDTTKKIDSMSTTCLVGQTITKPADPQEEVYIFQNWFKEADCQNVWDFTKPVTNDHLTNGVLKLYSKWSFGNISGFVSIPSRLDLKVGGSGTPDKVGIKETITLEVPPSGPNIIVSPGKDSVNVSCTSAQTVLTLSDTIGKATKVQPIQVQNGDGTPYETTAPLATLKIGGTTSVGFRLESLKQAVAFEDGARYDGWLTFTMSQ